jgi:hypothetical protein
MDISDLSKLAEAAGVPGVALGVTALVLLAVANKADVLPKTWRGPVFIVIAAGAALLGVLTIVGFTANSRSPGAQIAHTKGDHSAASNRDESKTGGAQDARTEGAGSPATNIRK